MSVYMCPLADRFTDENRILVSAKSCNRKIPIYIFSIIKCRIRSTKIQIKISVNFISS